MGFAKGRRRMVVVAGALLVTVVVAATAYRVLAPAEVSTPAQAAYPDVANSDVGVIGRLPVAPLIVDGRLRVYAADRQVYADQPVTGKNRRTPYWSYRRWPARLDGVLAKGTTVLSRWSDGKLVALDARTGQVSWRADGPEPAAEHAGPERAPGQDRRVRRTGAATVWDPRGLHVTRGTDGRPVLVVTGDRQQRGFDLADGRELWRADATAECRTDLGTTLAGQVATVDACGDEPAVELRDAVTGAVATRWRPPGTTDALVATLTGCQSPRSECRGLRTTSEGDGTGRGWLLGAGEPVAAPALDRPDTELVGEHVVGVIPGGVTGRSPRTGEELWRRADLGSVRILAAQPGRVHLLTETSELVTLDPSTGAQRSRFVLTVGRDGLGWEPGYAYAVDGYLAVERLKPPVAPEAEDQRYFLTGEALVLAAT
ncbi:MULTISPECIES: outer membrane protein assembly factor BamB family protein [Micromonospora]|uniref:Pyrrolo-quinoline quinone repeat domain-containing protein n=1 Tax=Micromonospora yangpuensis TaxID=683228 RepID=A0A1C6VFW2_9ACTN|nr:PQQ-binding-like beta-propeller repeat protein [Micromonospora yangpuensis]GGM30398.1 hypothetical protein GCM10012279_56670 [Micromonospora yangpuensis]SCL64750.1 hypothetical protein GA0070617_5555 [Micromonospora yangpuensis]